MVQNLRDTAVLDQHERAVGGGRGAGVVGQNAKTSADREVLLREGGILRKGENAVLLIGARQDNRAVGEGLAVKPCRPRSRKGGRKPQSKMTRRLST